MTELLARVNSCFMGNSDDKDGESGGFGDRHQILTKGRYRAKVILRGLSRSNGPIFPEHSEISRVHANFTVRELSGLEVPTPNPHSYGVKRRT